MQNLLLRWRATRNPDMYHGWGHSNNYFEGWYFKIVDAKEQHVFAIIPGISLGGGSKKHAFIQILDGKNCKAYYHYFKVADFIPSKKKFQLQLGNNHFALDRIKLDLPELKGELKIQKPTPWPKMFGAPGIMGWYSFVPFMECYHGVVSLHHLLQGHMEIYDKKSNFNGGVGYIEKDWGVSFPQSWIWMQSNHFSNNEKICFMASIAHIPWLGSHFIGYIVGFQWGEKLYRFATYTGAKMKAALHEKNIEIAFKDSRYRIEIIGEQAPGAKLVSPITGEMAGKVNESMQAALHVRFYEKDKLIFSGIGKNAGLEIAGNVDELLTEKWRR